MSLLSKLPFPVRIVLFMLVGVLLFRVLGKAGGLLIIAAAILWLIALLGLLYASGHLNALARVPVLASGLGALTRSSAKAGPGQGSGGASPQATKSAPSNAVGERELTSDERIELTLEAEQVFDRLLGIQEAVDLIDERLMTLARDAKLRGEKGFGTDAPTLVGILSGPAGVGKTESAIAVAKLYAGAGILKTSKIVVMRERDVKGGFGSAVGEAAQTLAQQAVDGALILDNADWLTETDTTFNASPGVDVGLAILDVVQENPQRLLVLLTLSGAADRRLRNDPRHAQWLNKLTVRSVPFEHLDDDALFGILRRHLGQRNVQVEPDAEKASLALIRDLRHRMGDEHFDNAEACRRLAEDLVAAATLRSRQDGESTAIAKEDVRQVQESA